MPPGPADQTIRRSYPRDLGQMVEMAIARAERQIVLQDERRDPEIVRGDGGTLSAKLRERRGVVVGGLLVCEQDLDVVLHQKAPEKSLVLSLSYPCGEPCPQLADD